MSRRSEHAGTVLAFGVLLGSLELLSIGAATRWPTVDDPSAQSQRATTEVARSGTAQRSDAEAEMGETQASLLLGQQLLARIDGALDAARFELASQAGARAQSPYDRFCAIAHRCD